MVDQEKISPHKGGILAYVVLVVLKCFLTLNSVSDEMGLGKRASLGRENDVLTGSPLGKTVQMIATMAANLPQDSPQTTLIVVPSALLFQVW